MEQDGLYKQTLLDHFRRPRNRADHALDDADVVRRGANPRCGDEIEVGLYLDGERIRDVKFRGRGCSVCIASSSMMTDAVSGQRCSDVRQICNDMHTWFEQGDGQAVAEPPDALEALAAVREYPARRRCVMLSWEALGDALDAL